MKQISAIKGDGKIVISIEKSETYKILNTNNIGKADEPIIHNFTSKENLEELFNRSEIIVSRAGYTNIMDLAILGKKALLIPVPNQLEQEYLAQYNREKEHFYSVMQDEMNLERDITKALNFPGIRSKCTTMDSVENIMRVIFSGEKYDTGWRVSGERN